MRGFSSWLVTPSESQCGCERSYSHAEEASVGSAVSVREFMFQAESAPPDPPLLALVRDKTTDPEPSKHTLRDTLSRAESLVCKAVL